MENMCKHETIKTECAFCSLFPYNKQMKVSVMIPTCNRYHWFAMAIHSIKNQTWLANGKELELVIVEDGEQDVRFQLTGLSPLIALRYVRLDGKHPIGYKRNLCLDNASGDILIFHDDDDYYQPEHIEHVVESLSKQTVFGVAGCSLLVAYSTTTKCFYVSGKAGRNDSPCGILAFTRRAMKQYKLRFRDKDTHAEEVKFLKDFRVPLLHLDPHKTIIAIQHGENTWNCKFSDDQKIDYTLPEEVMEIINNINK